MPKLKLVDNGENLYSCYDKNYMSLCSLNPYKYSGKFMLSTIREIHLSSVWVNNNLKDFDIPVLAIHSKNDFISCLKGTKNFINKINSNDKELFVLDEGNHTLLVPINKKDCQPIVVISKITNWINSRI